MKEDTKTVVLDIINSAVVELSKVLPARNVLSMTEQDWRYKNIEFFLAEALREAKALNDDKFQEKPKY